ncbi:MAG: DUF6265 family protein [Gammaproteobacteria bacterium]|nr:DUF6265 family protein [Gammaproteobacteria bacterium]
MRYWLCAVFLLMSTNSYAEPSITPSGIESLAWMVGSWKGTLGPQTVEETWSSPRAGSMDAMIRLSTPEGVQMIELIVIREVQVADGEDSLMLHLRQFSPALELRTSLDMQRQAIAAQSVSFVADESAAIEQLTYTRMAQDHLRVEVTLATGEVFTAHLQPD